MIHAHVLGRSSFVDTPVEQSMLIDLAQYKIQLHKCDMQITLSTAIFPMHSVRCAILMPNADMLTSLSQPTCPLSWLLRCRFLEIFKVVIPELSITQQ
jgi:hypothetical protein